MSLDAPVFIVGNPRSGTTLVQQILTAHDEFWTAPETHIFSTVLANMPKLRTHYFTPDELKRVLKQFMRRSNILLPDDTQNTMIEQAAAGTMNAAQLMNGIMEALKPETSDAARWIEKTPHHVLTVPQIWQCFPHARVINLLRDPRDAISSPKRFRRFREGAARLYAVDALTERWNTYVAAADALERDPRLITIQYEALIAEPEATLTTMAEHIGITPDMTSFERFNETFSEATLSHKAEVKALNNAPTIIDRRGIWKKRLTSREARVIEMRCAANMRRHGYTPEYPKDRLLPLKVRMWTFPRTAQKTLRGWKKSLRRSLNRLTPHR